jgi:hypothetical protein
MELMDPELRDALLSSTPSLLVTVDSVEDAGGTTPTPRPGDMEGTVTQPLCGN